ARIHATVRLVDLDEVGAGLDERPTLGIDDRDQIRQQRVLVAIAATHLERHQQGIRTRYRRLDAPGGQRAPQLELLHHAEPFGRADPLDHLERRVRVPERLPQTPRGWQGPDAGETLVEADDESHTHHLARADHVDAGTLLVEERDLRRVFHEL